MFQSLRSILAGIATVGVISGCGGPMAPASYDEGDLTVSVSLLPGVVDRAQQLTVRAEMHNRSDHPTNHSSGSSCPYVVRIFRNGADVTSLFPEPRSPCLIAGRSFPVPAQSSREFPFQLTAAAPPGEYEVMVKWKLHPLVKDVAARLVIR